jgi:type II secretory pathway pseudopilin PulG
MKKKHQIGSTLIEVILVTLVVATVLTALAASVSMSSKNTNENKKLSAATSLVQETLEMFHKERYSLGWETFQSALSTGTYCFNTLPDNSTDFVASNLGECSDEDVIADTNFQREATLTVLADEVKVMSIVTWMSDSQEKQVEAEQTFKEIN